MTTEPPQMDDRIARAFLAQARALLVRDYLPRIERCLAALDDTDVWWRANAESNSVGNLLLHLAGNARQWLISGVGGAADVRERDSEFAATDESNLTKTELLARLRATIEEADDVLARLTPTQLLEPRTIQNLTGVTVLEAVFHVVEHFSMHTGQIILITKLRAARALALYQFTDGVPRKTWEKQ